jgi:hypothetical protein
MDQQQPNLNSTSASSSTEFNGYRIQGEITLAEFIRQLELLGKSDIGVVSSRVPFFLLH